MEFVHRVLLVIFSAGTQLGLPEAHTVNCSLQFVAKSCILFLLQPAKASIELEKHPPHHNPLQEVLMGDREA